MGKETFWKREELARARQNLSLKKKKMKSLTQSISLCRAETWIVIVISRFLLHPQKAKSQESAISQVLNQNKIDKQGARSSESARQTVRRL